MVGRRKGKATSAIKDVIPQARARQSKAKAKAMQKSRGWRGETTVFKHDVLEGTIVIIMIE